MRILGLDPGSRVCGYGVIDVDVDARTGRGASGRGAITYVECGILTAPADRAMEARLGEIACGLKEVIAELRPTVVAVEAVFVHEGAMRGNVKSGLALAQARGMALAVIGLAGLSVASYPPATVKKAVSGSGKAEKTQVARMVQALVGMKSLPRADATDALAVAIAHAVYDASPIAQRERETARATPRGATPRGATPRSGAA